MPPPYRGSLIGRIFKAASLLNPKPFHQQHGDGLSTALRPCQKRPTSVKRDLLGLTGGGRSSVFRSYLKMGESPLGFSLLYYNADPPAIGKYPHCNSPQNKIVLNCLQLISTPCVQYGPFWKSECFTWGTEHEVGILTSRRRALNRKY